MCVCIQGREGQSQDKEELKRKNEGHNGHTVGVHLLSELWAIVTMLTRKCSFSHFLCIFFLTFKIDSNSFQLY